MTLKPAIIAAVLAALALGGCQQQGTDTTAVAQGSAPEGTISDELPNLNLLPNDAPLADPADLPPVPGSVAPVTPTGESSENTQEAEPEAPAADRPAEPKLEGSIAE
ncbi:hypothetical protein C7451_10776 [Blastomonas natatoria]|uniref:Lipoprotein n=1 Tax=Blastomonas natatoria TaxID=34015 RepID=A0A2V3V0A4_9SPHN|nr:hypothetical protein [Blastomonas natatoria]PXW75107.1 hypothetical protein C7451_10776 [Blastomonas natatoria]